MKIRSILLSILIILSFSAYAQWNPSIHIPINDALGQAQQAPIDGRSMFYITSPPKWRPYQSTSEVLSTLTTTASRFGNFIIIVDSGGSLQSNGTFTNGHNTYYIFADSTTNGGLVKLNLFGNVALPQNIIDSVYRINDSTFGFNELSGYSGTVLLRGTAAGGIASLTMAVPVSLFVTPVTFANTSGAWLGTLSTVNQSAGTFFAAPATGGLGQPVFRSMVISDLPTGIPNGNLANSLINLSQDNTGTIPGWATATVSLGGTALYHNPAAGPTTSGYLLSSDWLRFNSAVTQSVISVNGQTGVVVAKNADSLRSYPINFTNFHAGWVLSVSPDSTQLVFNAPGSGSGITTLNGLGATTQTFATGYSGTSPNIVSSGSVHTFNNPLVSGADSGIVSPALYNSWNSKQTALSGTGYLTFSGSTPTYLTATQVTANLNLFTNSLQGLVPGSGGGTTNFLRSDGSWAAPPGGTCPTCYSTMTALGDTAVIFNRGNGTMDTVVFNTSGGGSYTFPYSVMNTGGAISLVGDAATPGNSMYWGTNGSGTKGFYTLPSGTPGGSNTDIQFNNSGAFGGSGNLTWNGTTESVTGALSVSSTVNLTGITSGSGNDSILSINTSTGKVTLRSGQPYNIYAIQGLSVFGVNSPMDSIGFGNGVGFYMPDTLKTNGQPFMITGLPNEASLITGDSVPILNAASKKMILVPTSAFGGGTPTLQTVTTAGNTTTLPLLLGTMGSTGIGFSAGGFNLSSKRLFTNGVSTFIAEDTNNLHALWNGGNANFYSNYVNLSTLKSFVYNTLANAVIDSTVGTLWDDNFLRSSVGSNYTVTSPDMTVSISGTSPKPGLKLVGIPGNYVNTVARIDTTVSENFYMRLKYHFNIAASSTTYGACATILSTNANGYPESVLAGMSNFPGADYGYAYIIGGITHSYQKFATSGVGTISLGDTIQIEMTRSQLTYTVTVTDLNTLGTSTTSVNIGISTILPFPANNTSTPAITFLGSGSDTLYVSDFTYKLNDTHGPDYLVLGNSIVYGEGATALPYRFSSMIFNNSSDVVNWGGGADYTTNLRGTLAEIYLIAPKTVIMGPLAGNDLLFGISTATWETNLQYMRDQLVAHGIKVIWACDFPRSDVNTSVIKTYIQGNSDFSADVIIPQTYDSLAAPGSTVMNPIYVPGTPGDGIHPNNFGHQKAADLIRSNIPAFGYLLRIRNPGFGGSGGSGGSPGIPTAVVGLSAINGSASTFMRSDAAPALNQAITPTWTGVHIFNANVTLGSSAFLYVPDAIAGSTTTGNSLTLWGNTAVANGFVKFGTEGAFDIANSRIGIGTQTPSYPLDVRGSASGINASFGTTYKMSIVADYGGNGDIPANSTLTSCLGCISGGANAFAPSTSLTTGVKLVFAYYNGTANTSALEFANVASGTTPLKLMKGGGDVLINTSVDSLASLVIGAGTATNAQAYFAPSVTMTSTKSGYLQFIKGASASLDSFNFYHNGVTTNLLAGGSTPTFQLVLTAGTIMTGANTVALGANNFTFTSSGGVLAAPTASASTNTTQVATTAMVQSAIAANVGTGIYTATLTNTTNVASSTLVGSYYSTINGTFGTMVHLVVTGTFTPSVGSLNTVISISLPGATATTSGTPVGTGTININSGTAYVPAMVTMGTTTVTLSFIPTSAVSSSFVFSCDYFL